MRTTVKLSSIKIPKSYAATIPSEKKVKTKTKVSSLLSLFIIEKENYEP